MDITPSKVSKHIMYFAPSVDRNMHKSVQLLPAPIYLFCKGGFTLWLWAGRGAGSAIILLTPKIFNLCFICEGRKSAIICSTSQATYLSSNGVLPVLSWLLVKRRGAQWAGSLPRLENLTRRRVPTTRFGRKEETHKIQTQNMYFSN